MWKYITLIPLWFSVAMCLPCEGASGKKCSVCFCVVCVRVRVRVRVVCVCECV